MQKESEKVNLEAELKVSQITKQCNAQISSQKELFEKRNQERLQEFSKYLKDLDLIKDQQKSRRYISDIDRWAKRFQDPLKPQAESQYDIRNSMINLFDTILHVITTKQYNQTQLYELHKTQQESNSDGSNPLLRDMRLDLE